MSKAKVLAKKIKDYLKANEELYLVEPDNLNQFLEKLDYVIDHYGDALIVGNAGRHAAMRLFSAKQICEKMLK